eukprot:5634734-Prymnesium_polylepis.1
MRLRPRVRFVVASNRLARLCGCELVLVIRQSVACGVVASHVMACVLVSCVSRRTWVIDRVVRPARTGVRALVDPLHVRNRP